jgi:hypothetical protein
MREKKRAMRFTIFATVFSMLVLPALAGCQKEMEKPIPNKSAPSQPEQKPTAGDASGTQTSAPVTAKAEQAEQDEGNPAKVAETPQEEQADGIKFEFADKGLHMVATDKWEKVEPRVNMIEVEFKIPKSESDENDGRLTIMGSGGSVEDNLIRWYGQFIQPDGKDSAAVAKVEEKTIQDMKVHLVDISGTFLDKPGGPFGPSEERENYRMLAAIIESASHGNYFVKFYGPAKTVDDNHDAFMKLVDSVRETD